MSTLFLFAAGIFLLVKGADFLVDGASALARKLGVPALMVGLTVVAFGTSLPELVVNVLAALRGSTGIAFGNILGSNMANILLVLGAAAILEPLPVKRSTVRREIPFALLAVIVLIVLTRGSAGKAVLSRGDGLILICFFGTFLYYTAGLARRHRPSLVPESPSAPARRGPTIALMIAGGLVALYFGGRWTVDGAVAAARILGLSDYLISATVIAIGTSLPELMTAVAAARKKDIDIAVGNSVGSNIFNIFWVLGLTAVIRPIGVPAALDADVFILLAVTGLLFAFLFIGQRHVLRRWKGVLFIATYALYLAFLAGRG
jgi:cation:H+ antiporter